MHTAVLLYRLGLRGAGRPIFGRLRGGRYALGYLPLAAAVEGRSMARKKLIRPARAALKRWRRRVLTRLTALGVWRDGKSRRRRRAQRTLPPDADRSREKMARRLERAK